MEYRDRYQLRLPYCAVPHRQFARHRGPQRRGEGQRRVNREPRQQHERQVSHVAHAARDHELVPESVWHVCSPYGQQPQQETYDVAGAGPNNGSEDSIMWSEGAKGCQDELYRPYSNHDDS